MSAIGVRRDKAALSQWVQVPVGRKNSIGVAKQPIGTHDVSR
jgi:hypothetical protein